MRRLPWRVLPPGELSVTTLHQHYDRLQQVNPRIKYERERITKAFSLRPHQCYIGRDEFEGYMILTFVHTPKALLKRAGLPQIRFHDLRHTCATLLLGRNVNPKIVSEMLGHATIAITLDTYSHVLPNMQSETAKAMEDALS
jgi:integrase